MKKILSIIVLGLLLSSNAIGNEIKFQNRDYAEIEGDIKNPDRGWYYQVGHSHQKVSSATFWTPPKLDLFLIDRQNSISNWRVYFSLENFQSDQIDEITLRRLEEFLIAAKTNKVGIIPQFYYHWGSSKLSKYKKLYPKKIKNGKWISPSEEIIFKHIEQIARVINRNKEAVSYMHAGFLGAWGEWNKDQYGDERNYHPFRKKIIEKLLSELDKDILISLRYPVDHLRLKNHEEYYRLGFHHDCPNYKSDTYGIKKAYKLTPNIPMDGEMCKRPAKTSYSCKTMKKYFKKYHWDILNISNWSGTIKKWEKKGCLNEIEKKLGYRFVINGSKYKNEHIYFKVANVGWGKSFKSRKVSIKVKDKIFKSDIDIKNWKPGNEYTEKIYVGKQQVEFGTLIIEDEVRFANTTGNKIFFY